MRAAAALALASTAVLFANEYRKGAFRPAIDPAYVEAVVAHSRLFIEDEGRIPHGGDQIAQVLRRHGVRHLFCLSGGHVAPVYVAAAKANIEVVDVRHEVNAAFAADAYARLTGSPGIGPGVTNTITALQNAKMAESPVILLGGLQSLVKWSAAPKTIGEAVQAVEDAFFHSASGVPGPVFVELPMDLTWPTKELISSLPPTPNTFAGLIMTHVLNRYVRRVIQGADRALPPMTALPAPAAPRSSSLSKVVSCLQRARRPLLIIGSQAMLQQAEVASLVAAVTRLGLPVYLNGMARGLLGTQKGLQFRHMRKEAIREADVVVLAGVVCDFRLSYGQGFSRCTLITVNRSKVSMNMNRKPDIGVHSDPATFLIALAASFQHKPHAEWLDALRNREEERNRAIAQLASAAPSGPVDRCRILSGHLVSRDTLDARPVLGINPIALLREVDRLIATDSVIVVDGGDFVATAAYTLSPRAPLSWLDPGVFGTLGVGAGFALAAKCARPATECWLIYGDGALGFSVAEFDTFVRRKIGVIAIVGNDGAWMQIARDQSRLLGATTACELAYTNYQSVVEGFGGKGFLLTSLADVEPVLRQAKEIAARGIPVLINCVVAKSDFREGSMSV